MTTLATTSSLRPSPETDSHTRRTDPALPPGSLNLAGNLPPVVPTIFEPAYRAAVEEVLSRQSMSELIGSHRFMGDDNDRLVGARFVSRRLGGELDPARIVLTNGTQSALDRLFDGLARSRGVLAVEELTYPAVKPMAARLGIRLCAVRIGADGILHDGFVDEW